MGSMPGVKVGQRAWSTSSTAFFGEYVGIIGFDQAPDVRHGMAKSA
jgi:hypothetical protein